MGTPMLSSVCSPPGQVLGAAPHPISVRISSWANKGLSTQTNPHCFWALRGTGCGREGRNLQHPLISAATCQASLPLPTPPRAVTPAEVPGQLCCPRGGSGCKQQTQGSVFFSGCPFAANAQPNNPALHSQCLENSSRLPLW